MEQAKRRKIEMIAGLVLVVLAFLGNGHLFMHQPNGAAITITTLIFTSIALVFAGIYVGTEFKKSSAKLYKIFLYSYILKLLTGALIAIETKASLFAILCSAFLFVIVNVLLWVDDLGKMKSIVLSSLVFAVELYLVIHFNFISRSVDALDASLLAEGVFVGFAQITLSLVLVMMVHLKYVDKEMRKGKD